MQVNQVSKQRSSDISNNLAKTHVLLFDLSVGGHHPSYILYLIKYWIEKQYSGLLTIVITPKFLDKHVDVISYVKDCNVSNVQFVAIDSQEEEALSQYKPGVSAAFRAFKEWRLFCKYAKICQADQALLMYFDTAQVPFIFGQKPPCSISGIYFRPTFHYSAFTTLNLSFRDYVQVFREKFNLSCFLKRAQLSKLFCLDPFVVSHINKKWGVDKALYLPDPVQIYEDDITSLDSLKVSLDIQADRQIFLMFGALTQRKGIDQVLDAIPLLSKQICEKLCLLMVGPLGSSPSDKERLMSRISHLREVSAVQIVLCDRFIVDREVQPYFQIADFVLATYQKHVGMSNILVRAALAQKPVISSNYGLMGEVTRKFKLGIVVDSTNPVEISSALSCCIAKEKSELGDAICMRVFGENNLAESFSKTILQNLLGEPK